jgi:hypothetical protein
MVVVKAYHMAEFALLYLLCFRALRGQGGSRASACGLLMCLAFAASDEWHQTFVPDLERRRDRHDRRWPGLAREPIPMTGRPDPVEHGREAFAHCNPRPRVSDDMREPLCDRGRGSPAEFRVKGLKQPANSLLIKSLRLLSPLSPGELKNRNRSNTAYKIEAENGPSPDSRTLGR